MMRHIENQGRCVRKKFVAKFLRLPTPVSPADFNHKFTTRLYKQIGRF